MSVEQNKWAVWQSMLDSGKKPELGEPAAQGFYRINRTGYAIPVAVWFDGEIETPVFVVGDKTTNSKTFGSDRAALLDAFLDFEENTFPDCVAVLDHDYVDAQERGFWFDGVPTKPTKMPSERKLTKVPFATPDATADATKAFVGRNMPDDPRESIMAELNDLLDRARPMVASGAAQSQDHADHAANLAKLIGDVGKRIDAMRKVEKEPHMKSAKEVDDKWMPLGSVATNTVADLKRKVIDAFLRAERERQQREIAEKAKAGAEIEARDFAPITAGARGMKVVMRTIKRVEIADLKAATAFVAAMESPPSEFVDVVKRIADRLLRAGVAVPGARLVETQQVA